MKIHQPWTALVAAILTLWATCLPFTARADDVPRSQKLNVLATTTQIQDFTRNVGSNRINVIGILDADADPHSYQPKAGDARKFSEADVVFYNGVGLESWLDELAQNVRPGVLVGVNLAATAALALRAGEESDEEPEGGDDPHVWFDPTNAERMVNVIRDTLSATDPGGAATYASSARTYNALLDQLDAQIQEQIDMVPLSDRVLVTNHDAFGYYIDRYGLDFIGSVIPSLSTEAQPSASETRQLIQKIRDVNVKAIFTERSLNPRLVQQIAQEAEVQVVSDLFGDALGPAGSPGDTYIKMMQFNTQSIVNALR